MAETGISMGHSEGPILHVVVVGFHHKKGCQVEYSFPPLIEGAPYESNECPTAWKYLPTLALPDGSHNFEEDTVYFHLPSLKDPKQTVYGISCFRQIPVEKLTNRTADITRGTVQKSVCVLSTLPLYGHIQVKMALITHAYFQEGDFSKVSLLQDTYHNLRSCVTQEMLDSSQLFVGLSLRDFILHFKHKAVLMFKLLLLERKVLFFKSPVQQLCTTILSLLSLHPGMLEKGLKESACVKPSRPMSPVPEFNMNGGDSSSPSNSPVKEIPALNRTVIEVKSKDNSQEENEETIDNKQLEIGERKLIEEVESKQSSIDKEVHLDLEARHEENNGNQEDTRGSRSSLSSSNSTKDVLPSSESLSNISSKVSSFKGRLSGALNYWSGKEKSPSQDQLDIFESAQAEEKQLSLPDDERENKMIDIPRQPDLAAVAQLSTEKCGLPLAIFTKGYLCHPYLSLPYLDLLVDIKVRGYIIGATNVLFKQKRRLTDVLIEIDDAKIDTQDNDLKRQLHLTTEDLRFADYVVKHVLEERHDVFLDGVGWEGGDEWIRAQFRIYLLCLMRTSLLEEGSKELEYFNSSFISAWKSTHNYKMWQSEDYDSILEIVPGHPFAGQLSVADMKLRLSHTMQNTESGRKLNQAMMSTGRAVAHTGRAVGGALSQARGALSSWWTTFTAASQYPELERPPALEFLPDRGDTPTGDSEDEDASKHLSNCVGDSATEK